MKKALLVLGALLVILGLVDFGGNRFADFDLWGEIGIQLPDLLWKYSSYIEIALGFVLFNLGRDNSAE